MAMVLSQMVGVDLRPFPVQEVLPRWNLQAKGKTLSQAVVVD